MKKMEKCLLPNHPPTRPPATAAASQHQPYGGKMYSSHFTAPSPAAELQTMNAADTAAASFIFAQPSNNNTGLRKIPPPIFKKPEANPMIAPVNKASHNENGINWNSPSLSTNRINAIPGTPAPVRVSACIFLVAALPSSPGKPPAPK